MEDIASSKHDISCNYSLTHCECPRGSTVWINIPGEGLLVIAKVSNTVGPRGRGRIDVPLHSHSTPG